MAIIPKIIRWYNKARKLTQKLLFQCKPYSNINTIIHTLQNILMEKFWSNSCWNICGGFTSALLPGRHQLCVTGGRTACLSFFKIFNWSTELDDFSREELPGSPTESLGTRKLAIAPNAVGEGAGAVSLSRPVCPNTVCMTKINCNPCLWEKR